MITFEYNGKIYKPSNLENKLKKLGITINDIKIIDDAKTKADEIREKNEFLLTNRTIKVYWDTECKGWFLYKNTAFPDISDDHRYILIGNTTESELDDFIKNHFREALLLK